MRHFFDNFLACGALVRCFDAICTVNGLKILHFQFMLALAHDVGQVFDTDAEFFELSACNPILVENDPI